MTLTPLFLLKVALICLVIGEMGILSWLSKMKLLIWVNWGNFVQRPVLGQKNCQESPSKHMTYSNRQWQLSRSREPGKISEQKDWSRDMFSCLNNHNRSIFPIKLIFLHTSFSPEWKNFQTTFKKEADLLSLKSYFALNNILVNKWAKTTNQKRRKSSIHKNQMSRLKVLPLITKRL